MALLADFKTVIGDSTTDNDDFYIRVYLRPILDIASKYFDRSVETTVNFGGGLEYDLTDPNIASPVVGESGMETIRVMQSELQHYQYGIDYRIKDRTKLYFADSERVPSSTRTIRYNPYFTSPVAGGSYTETDAPEEIFIYLIDWAEAQYQIRQIIAGNNTNGLEELKESNISRKFGSIQSRHKLLESIKSASIYQIKAIGQNPYGLFSTGIY